jgi:predicted O-methyltransferase YrrM
MRLFNGFREIRDTIRQILGGIDNQTDLLNRKFEQLFVSEDNQSDLINRKFDQLSVGDDNQSNLLNRKFDELIEGNNNQTDLLNRKFEKLFVGSDNQSDLINRKFEQLIEKVADQSSMLDRRLGQLINKTAAEVTKAERPRNFDEVMERTPLLIADRTFNTYHPDYEAVLVRNFPGKIFNRKKWCPNPAFADLVTRAEGDEIPDNSWNAILAEALVEASSVPGASQVFERRIYIENYMAELSRKYHAHYVAGWVNLYDALFLYWLVRQTKPRKIVQCGACNGLSSSFMMLGLAKNGPEGTMSIIDLAPVFDPKDPEWTEEGKAHGVCIPEGKTTAWMVPDAYRDRLEVWNGDAKEVLPKMIDEVDSVDFFYHDSDHTYQHMTFEFREAKRKLTQGGLIVADDISWNSSLWDFADEFSVPSYNYKGAVGVAFF